MHHKMVPRDRLGNLTFRHRLLEQARDDRGFQAGMRELCRQDILFWLNAFCATFDPRRAERDRAIPWITYPFQDEAIPAIQAILGKEDLGIEKARTMTATWMILAVFVHAWQFGGMSALGVASAKEALVDNGPDPGSLFWKLRFLLTTQPSWLIGRKDYLDQKLVLKNHRTGSTIQGYATTGDMGRSGRLLALMIDEFAAFEHSDGYAADAATHAVTKCRIFNSTYKGAAGCFYEKMRSDTKRVPRQLSLPWTRHPEYARGLYYDHANRPRSPWYDAEVKRLVVDQFVKSELDMDPEGSASQFFPAELIERCITLDARPPYHVGRLENGQFLEAVA